MGRVAVRADCLLCPEATEAGELCRLSFGTIVRCQDCGLVRVHPPRSPEQLMDLHRAPEYFAHPYFDARRDVSRDTLVAKQREILERLTGGRPPAGARLLDVGCDTGALLRVARDEFGLAVLGVEVSAEAARVAREEHGLEVQVGDLADLDLPAAGFDFITLVDVLEHLSDPRVLLGQVHRLLRPGGKVYRITPNHDALTHAIGLGLYRLLGARSRGLLERLYIPYHEFYFTRSTLSRLLSQAGLTVERLVGREFPLDEFGHGLLLKLGLLPVFALQALTGRRTLQEAVAVKRD